MLRIVTMNNIKQIKGYEGLYTISTNGDVFSLYTNKKLKIANNGNGYMSVMLYKNKIGTRFYIHRLVGLHFIENYDNKPQINHKDGDKSNNNVDNLEWCTILENSIHSYKELGRIGVRGEDNKLSKLSTDDIVYIKNNKDKYLQRELASKFNVNVVTIGDILRGRTWCHIRV